MGELVEFIAKSLVDNPDMVEVNEVEGSQSLIIELKVVLMIWVSNRKTRQNSKSN